MISLTKTEAIECFHLAFVSVLPGFIEPSGFVLKGGANLRYFFGSVRYSEDIDLDVVRLSSWQIEEKVDRALEGPALKALLRAGGIALSESSKPKQTATTQRWKIGLDVRGLGEQVRTKIEFSHRPVDDERCSDPTPDDLVARYGIRPPMIQHYERSAAVRQKIFALAGRSETQARDVFDLDLLLRQTDNDPGGIDETTLARSLERALELPFEAYQDQVLPFLEPELVPQYEIRETWTGMQTFVADRLEGLNAGN